MASFQVKNWHGTLLSKKERNTLVHSCLSSKSCFQSNCHSMALWRTGLLCLLWSILCKACDTAVNEIPQSDIHASFIDFSRAFDTFDHCGLLLIIACLLRHTLYSYLTAYVQTVKLGGCCSQSQPMLSGVPQGDVLSLLSFMLCFIPLDDRRPRAVCAVKYSGDLTLTETLMGQLPGCAQSATDVMVSWGQDYPVVANSKRDQEYDNYFMKGRRKTDLTYQYLRSMASSLNGKETLNFQVFKSYLIYLGMNMISKLAFWKNCNLGFTIWAW